MAQSKLEGIAALHIKVAKLPDPVMEYVFHETRKWRFDFAWPDLKVALEVEGGTWSNGRHTRGKGFADDCEKYAEACIDGWQVIRATGDQIKDLSALNWLERLIKSRTAK